MKAVFFVMLNTGREIMPYVHDDGRVVGFSSNKQAAEVMRTHPLAKANGYSVHHWCETDQVYP